MTPYQQMIAEDTGTTDQAAVALAEEIMRCDRPTLDALTRPAFRRLARQSMAAAREMAAAGELDEFCRVFSLAVPVLAG